MTRSRAIPLLIGLCLGAVCWQLLNVAGDVAGASPVGFSVPTHADIDHIPVGTVYTNTIDVPLEAQGRTCYVSTANQSIHTGASVVLTSAPGAAGTLPLLDVEAVAGPSAWGSLLLGASVTATQTTGQDPAYDVGDGGWSLGAISVDCPDVPTTTTTTVAPPTTTTTLAPPVFVPPTRFTG